MAKQKNIGQQRNKVKEGFEERLKRGFCKQTQEFAPGLSGQFLGGFLTWEGVTLSDEFLRFQCNYLDWVLTTVRKSEQDGSSYFIDGEHVMGEPSSLERKLNLIFKHT